MKNLLLLFSIITLNACVISNTALNDNSNKPKNAKLVATNNSVNLVRTKYLDNGTDIRVYASFLPIQYVEPESFAAKYQIRYNFILDFTPKDNAEQRTVNITADQVETDGKSISLYFDIPKPKTDLLLGTLRIDFLEKGTLNKMQSELTVRFTPFKTNDQFGFFPKNSNHIILQNYIHNKDTVVIKSLDEKEQNFKIVRYKHEFDPALPPIATGQKPAPKPLFVDSLYDVKSNTPILLAQEAMYYIIKDTLDRTGISILGVDNRFPKLTKPEKLTKPLVYITTSQEFINLSSSPDSKKALDHFWLGLYSNNQNAAKKTIKSLYQKIEEANSQFTTYKEGWKTDKGMVYVVMGRPDQVRFLKDKEVWIYTKNSKYSEINFTFSRRSNQFVEDHFELNRYAEFQPIWYPAVEAWRQGEVVNN